ncbi:uncharacterized protein GLRG_08674 [Colletotrichum graminicola M1.001]|uniref:Uncharacterized protein n=1 Tax=Colletotrichum graminicola (strain M1.001 / M2 / FGSC 10212) TaxID=645133 RepID=E3QRA7_COLGM|nr:uncharacterized protein GLRG_08674 [Colletotrichum graminicola M1.001]EFQ33395.1 hypothetical protein GLRG_08674 [Colletotrichum graminicola M1.001]
MAGIGPATSVKYNIHNTSALPESKAGDLRDWLQLNVVIPPKDPKDGHGEQLAAGYGAETSMTSTYPSRTSFAGPSHYVAGPIHDPTEANPSCQCLDVVDAIADDPSPFAPLKRTSREITPSTPHKLPPPQLDELKPMAFASRKAVLSELLQCQ